MLSYLKSKLLMPDSKSKLVSDISNQIFTFPFGTVNISQTRLSGDTCLNFSIHPSYMFEDMIIKICKYISKVNEIECSITTDTLNTHLYYYIGNNTNVHIKINRNICTENSEINKTFNGVLYIPDFIFAKILYKKDFIKEELEDFIKDILPYIKNYIIENYRREILEYDRKVIEKKFFEKVTMITIKDAFAFVCDLIEGCIVDRVTTVNNGYIFKIPITNPNSKLTYQLNDTMINLLFELSEAINKIKIEYKELDSYINFDNNFINIHLYPENTGLSIRPLNKRYEF